MSAMLHPVTLVSLAVLVWNDHFLKWAHPSWLTGKLSDVAGMILAPIILSVATRHRAPVICALAVAVVFVLVKTWTPANHAWCATLGPLVKDPTDLIALPFAALAVMVSRRDRRRHHAPRLRPRMRRELEADVHDHDEHEHDHARA